MQTWTCKRIGWVRSSLEIWHDEELIARVERSRGRNKRKARISTPTAYWELEQAGKFTREVSVFDGKSGEEICLLEGGWMKGLEAHFRYLPEMNLQFLKVGNWSNKEYEWRDKQGRTLMVFYKKTILANRNYTVEVLHPEAPYTLLLAAIGLYLIRMGGKR